MDKSTDYSRFMDVLKANYRRQEQPNFASCYRRAQRIAVFASFQDWHIPSKSKARLLLDKDMNWGDEATAFKGLWLKGTEVRSRYRASNNIPAIPNSVKDEVCDV
ncbi:MAG: hypothetical protein JKX71_13985 [Amylibacter sp.]|nr:hypothetical protein [Amylibacter sp.]